jgi:hypothetical protein
VSAAEVRTEIKALKDQLRAYYPYRDYSEVDEAMARIQSQIADWNRLLDRIEGVAA